MITLVDPTSTHQRLLLAAALRTVGPMLELGAGWYSTPLLHEVAAAQKRPLLTVDTDAEWLGKFSGKGQGNGSHVLKHVRDWEHADFGSDCWGLAFVDVAPPLARGPLVRRLLDSADVFVLHDTEAPDAYGYEDVLPEFRWKVTDKAHWTWTTVASNAADVTAWGLEEFPEDERPRTVAQYLMRVFPGKNHWFVEAGAHKGGSRNPDGSCVGSVTLELEDAGWQGLCVEPSLYHVDLWHNRRCEKDNRPLGERDGERMVFRQVYGGDNPELSGLVHHFLPEPRKGKKTFHRDRWVHTARLSTVLADHGAPPRPEFLCLDTGGSELAVLRGHDFFRHRFQVVFVAYHGVAGRRQELAEFMESKGYCRSRGRGWDDGQSLTFVDLGVSG